MMLMKAQISSEFLIVYAALLMVFTITFGIIFGGGINLAQTQDHLASLRNSQAIASAINYVYLAGDGASYNLTLTNFKNDENITLTDYAVTSSRPQATTGSPLLDADINASSLRQGNAVITNKKGELDIQN